MNEANDNAVNPNPVAGGVATYRIGSDSYAMDVVEVSRTGHRVIVAFQRDASDTMVATRRQGGHYYMRGSNHGSVVFGRAVTRLDPGLLRGFPPQKRKLIFLLQLRL